MRGPAVGIALLLAAGLSVAVVPALRPTLVDGSAAAVPVPGIPAIGDCVTEPIPYSSLGIGLNTPIDDKVTYPALSIEPCDGPRYGEVVAVISDPVIVTVEVTGKTWSFDGDPNQDECWSASATYLGIDTGPTADAQWVQFLTVPSLVSQPSARQTSQGQNWLACLTYTQSADQLEPQPNGSTGPAEPPTPYTGTLRDALTTGNQTDQLGSCGDQFPLLEIQPGRCGRPHRYQQLVIAPLSASGAEMATLTATCTDTVNASIGRDVTSSPDLEIVVSATDTYGSPALISDTISTDRTLQCGVAATGNRLLANSVIGLGDRPIPWS